MNKKESIDLEHVLELFKIEIDLELDDSNKIETERFYINVINLFEANGYDIPYRNHFNAVPIVKKGIQEIYYHPQAISGVCLPSEIPDIVDMYSRLTKQKNSNHS